jgi:hypothetical protein
MHAGRGSTKSKEAVMFRRPAKDWDSGRLATVQLIRQGQADLTPLSPESTIGFRGFVRGYGGKRDCVPKSAERAAFIEGRRAFQRGGLSSIEVRPLPREIAICRAPLLAIIPLRRDEIQQTGVLRGLAAYLRWRPA